MGHGAASGFRIAGSSLGIAGTAFPINHHPFDGEGFPKSQCRRIRRKCQILAFENSQTRRGVWGVSIGRE